GPVGQHEERLALRVALPALVDVRAEVALPVRAEVLVRERVERLEERAVLTAERARLEADDLAGGAVRDPGLERDQVVGVGELLDLQVHRRLRLRERGFRLLLLIRAGRPGPRPVGDRRLLR